MHPLGVYIYRENLCSEPILLVHLNPFAAKYEFADCGSNVKDAFSFRYRNFIRDMIMILLAVQQGSDGWILIYY